MAQQLGSFGTPPPDGRLDAPAFHRNHAPIWSVLSPFLDGKTGDVLELGSGTGQHVVEFARRTPDIVWWPSECEEMHLHSIAAWRAHAQLAHVRAPLCIDVSASAWPVGSQFETPGEFLAVFSANVLHISPWTVSLGLFSGAARHLRPDGRLFVYGPFMRGGRHTAPSNAQFDASLRSSNPQWGVRDMDDLAGLAAQVNLKLIEVVPMPANNFTLVFAR
jgi:SAM-dependent methyltransferase